MDEVLDALSAVGQNLRITLGGCVEKSALFSSRLFLEQEGLRFKVEGLEQRGGMAGVALKLDAYRLFEGSNALVQVTIGICSASV